MTTSSTGSPRILKPGRQDGVTETVFPDLLTDRKPASPETTFRPLTPAPLSPSDFTPLRFQGGREIHHDAAAEESRRIADAERRVTRAAEQVGTIEREAREKGFEAGRREGREAAGREAAEILERLAGALKDMETLRQDLIRRAETEAVDLALVIAEKVAVREISLHRDILVDMVRQALEGERELERVLVRVSPADAAWLEPDRLRESLPAGTARHIGIEADERVREGCVIETPKGIADARIATRMARIAESLRGLAP